MQLPRMTTRRWMVVVAIVGLACPRQSSSGRGGRDSVGSGRSTPGSSRLSLTLTWPSQRSPSANGSASGAGALWPGMRKWPRSISMPLGILGSPSRPTCRNRSE